MLQKRLILNFSNKNKSIKDFLYIFFISLSAIIFTFYSGYRGIFPLDSFVIYDGGYKVLNGHHPFKDYWSISGPILDYIQSIFFKVFGINWFSYVLHAASINLLLSLLIYFFFSQLGLKKIYCFIYSLGVSVLGYPSVGTPFMDHHASIFSLIAILFLFLAIKKEDKIYWFLSPFFLFFSFMSKQIPSSYLLILFLIIIIFFLYLENFKKIKIVYPLILGGIISIFLFIFALKGNDIPFENFLIQYILYPLEIGSGRISGLTFNYGTIVSKFKFIYIAILPLLFVFYKISKKSNLKLEEKKEMLLIAFLVLSLGIFIYTQILTKNQILIFFLIPFVLGVVHYFCNKYYMISFLYYFLITILIITTFKYHTRFNINKKFMELNDVDLNLSINAKILDSSLNNVQWITPHYPKKPNYELQQLLALKNIIILDKSNKIIMTNYQILPSISKIKNFSPNKWLDLMSEPNIKSKFFLIYKNFFIEKLKQQNIETIYIMGHKIKYINNILKKNCYKQLPVNEIAYKIEISSCFK